VPKRFGMLSVLVVDDLQIDRLILKKQLGSDYRVTTLSSALEAKAFAHTHTFDIALLNVMLLNDLDCIELLKDLENITEREFLSIAITCHIDAPRQHKIMASGFKAIMTKPFDKNVFRDIVYKNTNIEESAMAFILRK